MTMIYLDFAASAPLRSEASKVMQQCLAEEGVYANPASDHAPGRHARRLVEQARERFAALIGALPGDIIWTSGATEANNLAILGAAQFHQGRGQHLLTSKLEHKAVLEPMRQLASQGWKLDYLPIGEGGVVDPKAVVKGLRDDTILVSCMLVNNETGVIQNIPAMAEYCANKEVLMHVDAAQALGRVPIDCRRWRLPLMSFSGHKCGGPKGVGALMVRRKPAVGLRPQIFGGGQERGLRAGTLPLHQILGMVRAAEQAVASMADEQRHCQLLRDALWSQLSQALPKLLCNGSQDQQSPHILNVSFPGVDGEALRADLDQLAVSSGSACTSDHAESSYVLRALGRDDALADASLRFSFSHLTSAAQLRQAGEQVITSVRRLRALSPSWEDAA